jgi:hypothetical protein
MQKHLRKDALFSGYHIEDELRGIVMPVNTFDDKTGNRDPLFSVVHLNENNLGGGVVGHECLHVALAHERMTMFGMQYGEECGTDEERLAYLLTDIIKGVYSALYDNKHIKGGRKA